MCPWLRTRALAVLSTRARCLCPEGRETGARESLTLRSGPQGPVGVSEDTGHVVPGYLASKISGFLNMGTVLRKLG